ncbi:uncharacterized protein LOC143153171 isoform X1 [Ptiloglossa arizonensis]|uniref:uncharacterized protein LOC143153171 isoform X1 n=1 Tax=Ptiloglossa arizonensis TaxID=3350558 RepID=UPI003FA164AB
MRVTMLLRYDLKRLKIKWTVRVTLLRVLQRQPFDISVLPTDLSILFVFTHFILDSQQRLYVQVSFRTISAAIVSQRNPALQSRKPNFQMESRENSCYASIALSEARGGNITSVLFDSKSELA